MKRNLMVVLSMVFCSETLPAQTLDQQRLQSLERKVSELIAGHKKVREALSEIDRHIDELKSSSADSSKRIAEQRLQFVEQKVSALIAGHKKVREALSEIDRHIDGQSDLNARVRALETALYRTEQELRASIESERRSRSDLERRLHEEAYRTQQEIQASIESERQKRLDLERRLREEEYRRREAEQERSRSRSAVRQLQSLARWRYQKIRDPMLERIANDVYYAAEVVNDPNMLKKVGASHPHFVTRMELYYSLTGNYNLTGR
jgi:chromosome segregation ATPase